MGPGPTGTTPTTAAAAAAAAGAPPWTGKPFPRFCLGNNCRQLLLLRTPYADDAHAQVLFVLCVRYCVVVSLRERAAPASLAASSWGVDVVVVTTPSVGAAASGWGSNRQLMQPPLDSIAQ
jgi:hypothetical protein